MNKRVLSVLGARCAASSALVLALALGALLPAGAAHAQLRSVDLAFRPPADTRVIGFHVYVASTSRSYADYRDNINFIPPVDGGGLAHFPLTGLELANVYISLKSYDATGAESAFSNEITLAATQQCLLTGCNDNNSCTVDTCGTSGCTFDPAPRRGSTCDDGNGMTFNDVCQASGSCSGTVAQCNVDTDCGAPADLCAGPKVCVAHMCQAGSTPRANDTTCNDGNAATKFDVCRSGVCSGFACGSDSQCSDGNTCNGAERCVANACVAGTPMVCNDNNSCTADTCSANACKFDPAPRVGSTCDDSNGMTFNDMCQATGSCSGTVAQCNVDSDCGAPADLCAGPRVCVAHMCQGGTTPRANDTPCNDGNAATQLDVCRSGVCRGFACGSDSQCSDGNACNGAERCVNNSCAAGTPMVCNDNNSCTADTCSANACKFDPAPRVGGTCDDSNGMTFNDMCQANGSCSGTVGQCNVNSDCGAPADLCAGPRACVAHSCQAGSTPPADNTTCNDGNAATRFDVCRSGVCSGFACGSDSQCSDGNTCNGAERCVANACVAGTPMVCNDNNSCTADTCSANACKFDPAPRVGGSCDDSNGMTFNDMCQANGSCSGTTGQCNLDTDCAAPADLCAGPRVCVAHMCQAGSMPRVDDTPCNDGNAATKFDVCRSGVCSGFACGSDSQCSDGQACNGAERCVANTCAAGTPMVCNDGNLCNGSETCVGSACVAGTAPQCPADDGPCFDAFCDPAQGCRVTIHPDGEACTTAMSGAGGQCATGVCVAMPTTPPAEDPNSSPHDPRPPPTSPNATCSNVFGAPTELRQELSDDAESSRKIVWRAPLHPMGSLIQFRLEGEASWRSLRAMPQSQMGCSGLYSVTLRGLQSGARYRYRVSGAAASSRVWTDWFSVAPGPTNPRAKYKFAFFAANGLASTAQSPQAALVLEQIKKTKLPLVLGGGGYALSTEAIAAGAATNAAQAIALWKDQASLVTGNSIFAPVLGDTEVESFAHAERASDYAEFTPLAGTAQTPYQSYSYDFGPTHFLAVNAPTLGTIHPSTAAGLAHLAWLDADLAAARARGVRWIVVYLHADLFSSDKSDASVQTVRTALGTILNRHGVNLVLSGEGDSYERTKALRGNTLVAGPVLVPGEVTTATDGVVFVRAGSGGRTVFTPWLRPAPPVWSAFRDNAHATYVQVTVSDNQLLLTTYALDENGKRIVLDTLKIF